MAKEKVVTTKFKADISQFKKGLSEARDEIKLANAKFKEATVGMEKWANSTDGLKAKIDQLQTVEKAQEKRIETLKGKQQEYIKVQKQAEEVSKDIEQQIKALTDEYEKSGHTQDDNSEATKGFKKELSLLEKQLEKAKKAQETNAKSARDLEVTITNESTALKQTKIDIDKYSKALDDLNASNSETKTSFEKLEDTINSQEKELKDLKKKYTELALEQKEETNEAKQLAKQISSLNGELNENKTKLNNAEKATDNLTKSFDEMGDEAEDTGDGFTILNGALADLASDMIQSAVSGIKDMIGSFFELIEATKEYRSMQAKLESSAKNNGYAIEYATDKYKEMYGYLGDDQMATNAVTNLMGLQTNQDTLNSLLDGATGVWASYGDSIPIESLTEAINETIKVGKVTGTFADTINWAKLSNDDLAKSFGNGSKAQKAFNKAIADGETQEDAFSKALEATSDEQERANLVANFLNKTYGKSKKTYDEMTENIQKTNKAEAELKDTQAEIAEILSPVKTAFDDFRKNALEAMIPIIEKVANGFMNLKKWLEEHPIVMTILTSVVAGLAGAFTTLALALGIQALISGVTKAMSFLGVAIGGATLPITLIVGAIAGLVGAFVYAWNNVDGFKQFWIEAWEKIKGYLLTAWEEQIKPTIQKIGELLVFVWKTYIKPTLQSIGDFLVFIWETYLKPTIKTIGEFLLWTWENVIKPTLQVLQEVFETVFQKIVEIWENSLKPTFEAIGRIFKSVWDTVLKPTLDVLLILFKGVFETIKLIWETVLKPVFKALGDVFGAVWKLVLSPLLSLMGNQFELMFRTIETFWNEILKPVFQAIGDFFSFVWNSFLSPTIESVKNGFQDMANTVTNIWNSLWGSIKGVINSILGGVESMANGVVDGVNKVIDTLNNLSFTIPDWVPKFGGKHFGFSIGHLGHVSLPRLAEGGLAKKNNPFMAIVGDNPTQDEIISPVGTIRKIVAEELENFMQGINAVKGGSNISNVSNNTTNQTFNQYITSPKALSTLEIYRQSRNLLKGGKA